jgi:FSR family fosmidomycin resistance protein-like MFS transporter
MSLFRNRLYLAITLGHFTIDVFSNMGPVLVTFFSVPMALSATQIGFAAGTYQLVGAISQPIFGWLVDKIGSRWIGPMSVAWTILFLVGSVWLAQTTNNFVLFMLPFSLAALGSGAFHPQGAMHAATTFSGRAATATAVFFLFGQGGLASGPALGGFILDRLGPVGIYGLAALASPFLIFMAYAMREAGIQSPTSERSASRTISAKESIRWSAIVVLALLIGLRSWTFLGTVVFLPKLFQDMGWSATSYGLITGTFWLAAGIAGVIAGNLADRWGRRQVVFTTLLGGSIFLYFLPLNSGWQAFPLAITSGGLLGASHSIIVVIAQAVLPGRKAFASGVTLGYMFGIGAFAAWGVGLLADLWSLTPVIQTGAGIGLLTALLALVLPATRETPQPQPESVPA